MPQSLSIRTESFCFVNFQEDPSLQTYATFLCGILRRKKKEKKERTVSLRYLSVQILNGSAEVKERLPPSSPSMFSFNICWRSASACADCQPAFSGKIARVISRDQHEDVAFEITHSGAIRTSGYLVCVERDMLYLLSIVLKPSR